MGEVIIDWLRALNQMGNDAPFLLEVLSDVLVEARDMVPTLHTAISSRDPTEIAHAGAQIHQSSTPLFCMQLASIAESIENAGRSQKTEDDWTQIQVLTERLCKALTDLNAEVARFSGNTSDTAAPETKGDDPTRDPIRLTKSLPSIDWDAAMTAVGEDHEFLVDVLSDFVSAASAGMAALSAAMLAKDLAEIKDVGHSIKGAAKPLSCHRIEAIAALIESAANPVNNPGGPKPERWDELSQLCEEYSACVFCLWSEIQSPGSAAPLPVASPESPPTNTIIANIDWEGALEKTGNDKKFLAEVLVDVIAEADKGILKLTDAIHNRDFEVLKKTAHRIKGGANSANCHRLASVSLRIEMTGKEGMTLPQNLSPEDEDRANELWDQVEGLLREYRIHLMALKAEISRKRDLH